MPPKETLRAPALDARLAAAASYVRRGGVCADIGCDHGKLCAYLAAQGICRRVIACDVRPAPLERARDTLSRAGVLDRADLRLGDGLSIVRPGEADSIVIAGMSGVTTAGILKAAPQFWREGTRFILVPATKHGVLRDFLYRNGFFVLGETPVRAAGRSYTVLCAEYAGAAHVPDLWECAVGKAAETHSKEAAAYLETVAAHCEKYARGAEGPLAAQVLELARRIREEIASWEL